MSNLNKQVMYAVTKGYTVSKEGKVFFRGKERRLQTNAHGYLKFTIRDYRKTSVPVPVHKLQAYSKFGPIAFLPTLLVRHLDGNCINNSWDNIELGTASDNMMDMPEEVRKAKARRASEVLACPVIADGVQYPSYVAAAQALGISDNGVRRRIKAGKPGYALVGSV